MLEIKFIIEAPELSASINRLAESIGKNVPASVTSVKQEVEQTVATDPVAQPVQQAQTAVPPQPAYTAPTSAPVAPVDHTVTLEAISRAGATLVDQGKMPQIMGLLTKYGVQAITQLNANTYDAFAADLRALGAAI